MNETMETIKKVEPKVCERQQELMNELNEKIKNGTATICDYVFTGRMLNRLETFKGACFNLRYGDLSGRNEINIERFIEYCENGVYEL